MYEKDIHFSQLVAAVFSLRTATTATTTQQQSNSFTNITADGWKLRGCARAASS